MRSIHFLFYATILAAGCKPSEELAAPVLDENTPIIRLVATSELNPPEKITKASVSPKPGFASWTGQILLLTDQGKVLSTNTGFSGFVSVHDGPFKDILGLSQGESPSIFLALDETGVVKAFKENEGVGFDPFPISMNELSVTSFCFMEAPSDKEIYVNTPSGHSKHSFLIKNDALIEIGAGESIYDNQSITCGIDKRIETYALSDSRRLNSITDQINPLIIDNVSNFAAISSENETAILFRSSNKPELIINHKNELSKIAIDAGLSIAGIENPEWVYSTSESMGNTFQKGLTLIGDQDSNRIVMIANDYLLDTVSNQTAQSAQ